MENLFDKITKSLPKPTPEQQQALAATYKTTPVSEDLSKLSLKDLVTAWQKDATPERTALVLQKLRPTIDSAITSYAGGDKTLDIKAANLALSSLKNYDASFGTEPSTYVFHNLKRLNRLSGQREAIIPRSEYSVLERNALNKTMNSFIEAHGREPSLAELADATGLSVRKVDKLLNTVNIVNDTSTLAEDTGASVYGKKGITDDDYFEYVYSSVGPVDQKIMEWASGYHKKPVLSNNEIAKRLRISAPAVSQRKAKLQQMLSDVRGLA